MYTLRSLSTGEQLGETSPVTLLVRQRGLAPVLPFALLLTLRLAPSYSPSGSSSSSSFRLALVAKALESTALAKASWCPWARGGMVALPECGAPPKASRASPRGRAVASCGALERGHISCDLRAGPLGDLGGDHDILQRDLRQLVALHVEEAPAFQTRRKQIRRVTASHTGSTAAL